jgi:hypothetical protein
VAVRKSSVVARSRSPLVASEKSPPLVRRVDQELWRWAVTVAVRTSHRTAQGSSSEVCEGSDGHRFRLS